MVSALKMTKQLLDLLPNHERANGNKVFYEKHLKEEEVTRADKKLKGDDGSDELEKENVVSKILHNNIYQWEKESDHFNHYFPVYIETIQQSAYLCNSRTSFV